MTLSAAGSAEWLPCDGRLLAVAEYPELAALVGNRFGGDGVLEFALPMIASQEAAHYVVKARVSAEDAKYVGLVAQMVLWVGEEIPANWMPCDGRVVKGADYPILQKAASVGMGAAPAEFHLPQLPAMPGLQYIICVDGLDPTAQAGQSGAAQNDDDY